MPVVRIPTSEIVDWESFHSVFQRVLGFPEFYGRNMNAWIDCLTSADSLDDGGMVANLRHHAADRVGLRCLIPWRCDGEREPTCPRPCHLDHGRSAGPAGKGIGSLDEASNHLRGLTSPRASASGTFRTWRDVLESAFGGKAEVAFQRREVRCLSDVAT